jgi:hypothetical protein
VLLSLDLHSTWQPEEFRLGENLVDFNENFSFFIRWEIKNYKPIQSTVAKH